MSKGMSGIGAELADIYLGAKRVVRRLDEIQRPWVRYIRTMGMEFCTLDEEDLQAFSGADPERTMVSVSDGSVVLAVFDGRPEDGAIPRELRVVYSQNEALTERVYTLREE